MFEGCQPKSESEVQTFLPAAVFYGPLVFHSFPFVPGAAVFFSGFPESCAGFEFHVYGAVPFGCGERLVPQGFGFGP